MSWSGQLKTTLLVWDGFPNDVDKKNEAKVDDREITLFSESPILHISFIQNYHDLNIGDDDDDFVVC